VTIPHQPPYPPQQPPPAPTGWVALTIQGSVMTSSFVPPKVWMNGHPVPVSYGENPVPVHPGLIRVDVRSQWLREYGQATLDIQVEPGQTVPVFYAGPMHQFSAGRIGHVKQERPGKLGFWLLMTLIIGLPLLGLLLVTGLLGAMLGS
jgi:hypothetical protein